MFEVIKEVDDFKVFDLKYYENDLNMIEEWHEGEITLLNAIKLTKKFINHPRNGFAKSSPKEDAEHFTYVSHFKNEEMETVAKIALVHGFNSCQDSTFTELALQFALNGIEVWMCDLRGFGLSSGERIKIDSLNMTRDVAVMLNEIPKSGTPLYLLGHSMGALILETFAQINGPFMDSNVSGMFYTTPFFGLHEHSLINIPRYKRILYKLFSGPIVYEGALINVGKRYDWLSSNSTFRRQIMKSTNWKTMPFVTYESWFKLLARQD